MNTKLTAFLNDLISSSIACSPKGSLHIKSSYDLTGASPKTRRAVQLGYHSTKTKSAGILDNVMNEVSKNKTLQAAMNEVATNKALQAGLLGATVGGGLTALTGRSSPQETLTHKGLRVLGNAALAGGLTGGAAYGIPKAIEEFSQALPANDVNPVDRITGSSPVRGLSTLGGLGVGAAFGRGKPSMFSGYSDKQLDAARKLWTDTVKGKKGKPAVPGSLPLTLSPKIRKVLSDVSGKTPTGEARTMLENAIKGNDALFDIPGLATSIPGGIGTLGQQLEHAGINTEKGFTKRRWFEAKNLGRNLMSRHGLAGLSRLGAGAAAGYFLPDITNAIGEKIYDTVTAH